MKDIHIEYLFMFMIYLSMCNWFGLTRTGAREQNILKVRVRKKVSIPLKAPEAALFKYVI